MYNFEMCSNLSCYPLKIDCYIHGMLHVNLRVTTKQKFIVNTQKKVRKQPKHSTKEGHHTTKEEKKKRKKKRVAIN